MRTNAGAKPVAEASDQEMDALLLIGQAEASRPATGRRSTISVAKPLAAQPHQAAVPLSRCPAVPQGGPAGRNFMGKATGWRPRV
jgi:hypothetical protein